MELNSKNNNIINDTLLNSESKKKVNINSEGIDTNSSLSSILIEDEAIQQDYDRDNNYLMLFEKMKDSNLKKIKIIKILE